MPGGPDGGRNLELMTACAEFLDRKTRDRPLPSITVVEEFNKMMRGADRHARSSVTSSCSPELCL